MAFIGREKETLLMQQALEQEQATILLYGKRKVGKTTLIKECRKNQSKQFRYFEPLIVVIDEYPYLKAATKAELVDSMMQSIIDNRLENLQLILSGSHIGMMKGMLEEGNALYGYLFQ